MGKWSLPKDYKDQRYSISTSTKGALLLEEYIDDVETRYLQDLLGSELFDEFIADLDGTTKLPTAQKFKDIFDPFFEDNTTTTSRRRRSEGIIEMLRYFTYFEFTRDQPTSNTADGTLESKHENAILVKGKVFGVHVMYNRGIESYVAIQSRILDDSTTYDNFEGITKKAMAFI